MTISRREYNVTIAIYRDRSTYRVLHREDAQARVCPDTKLIIVRQQFLLGNPKVAIRFNLREGNLFGGHHGWPDNLHLHSSYVTVAINIFNLIIERSIAKIVIQRCEVDLAINQFHRSADWVAYRRDRQPRVILSVRIKVICQ